MKLLIDQLIVLDRAFYRYYLEMLLTLEHTHAAYSLADVHTAVACQNLPCGNPLSGTAAYQHRQ